MVKTLILKPLGLVLEKSGLISHEQLATALEDQHQLSNLKIGEILAVKGWIKLETANFFAEQWPKLLDQSQKKPLGQHLKAAALLSDRQIQDILQQQQQTGSKFGSVAVSNGLLAQSTVDFFLEQLELIKAVYAQLNGAEDLHFIETYLLQNQECDPAILLEVYQKIWQQEEIISSGSDEERELIKSGLVVRQKGKVKIAKPIYRSIFNQNWIDRELTRLQPYSKIRLKLFGLETKASLPYQVLTEVKNWAGNQPFLTQKLYQIIRDSDIFIAEGQEAKIIEELARTHIIEDWQNQAAGEHLQELNIRLTQNKQCSPVELLKTYQKIWQQGELLADESLEQAELMDVGLIKQEHNKVVLANRIYQSVFNLNWIEEQLAWLIEPAISDKMADRYDNLTEYPSQRQKQKINTILIALLALIAISSAIVIGMNVWAKTKEERLFQEAIILLRNSEYEKALSTYDRVLKINQHNYQAWHNRGYAFAGLGQYQKMLQSCSSATVVEPSAADAWNCQGEALYKLDEYEQALAAFNKAIAINAQEPIFWLNRAESLLELKQSQSALEAIELAIKLLERATSDQDSKEVRTNLKMAWQNKGQALYQKQDYPKALEAYKQALSYDSEYLAAQWGKALVLKDSGRYTEARTELGLILQRTDLSDSQKAKTWFYQGLNLCDAGEVSTAVNAFATAIKLNPDYKEAVKAAQSRCTEENN